jgi:hypothetical protein
VDSTNLTTEQVRRMAIAVAHSRDYLARLSQRIAFKGFPDADPLKPAVQRAHAAVESLHQLLAETEAPTPRWVQAQREHLR